MIKDRKIKVLIGINDFLVGGAQNLLIRQFKHFDQNKFEFYLVTLFVFKEKTSLQDLVPCHVKVFNFDFKGFGDIANWYKLFKLLRKIKPDIIVSSLFFSNTIFRILGLLNNCRLIIIEHNTYIHKTNLQIFVDRLLSRVTYKIIAVSEEVINFTSKQEGIDHQKFIFIPNGVDVGEILAFRQKNIKEIQHFRKQLGFVSSDKIIINVARLTKQKGLDFLLDTFFHLSKTDNDYKMIILGEGSLRNDLINKIETLGLKDKVFLLGAKENIYQYYMMSDLFVLSSVIEGFALVCIEAMAFQLPVVSTKVAGPDKYIKNYYNGFLVERSTNEMVEKISFLFNLDSNEILKYKKNCLETAWGFDINNNVKQYENLFVDSIKN